MSCSSRLGCIRKVTIQPRVLKWSSRRGYTKGMNLRRARALPLAVCLIVSSARYAGAQGAAVPVAASKTTAPKRKAAKPKKKAVKVKKKTELESKYKSRTLSENSRSQYRFDADGNAIIGVEKKRSAAKINKKSSSEDSEGKPACTAEAPCVDKKSADADAL